MSKSSRKGYDAERRIEVLLQQRYPDLADNILRPRAGASLDKGDIHGLPVVISVKNYATPRLAGWVDQMNEMCINAGKGVGVVWHKVPGQGKPENWHITTDERSFTLLLDKMPGAPIHRRFTGVVSCNGLSTWLNAMEPERELAGAVAAVLIHARKGGDPYVTMTGLTFLTFLDAYLLPVTTHG